MFRTAFLEFAVDEKAALPEFALGEEGAVFKVDVVFECHAGAECSTRDELYKWHSVILVLY